MKAFMLAAANIRKSRGNTLAMVLMLLVSALLLCMGLSIILDFGSYFDELAEELNMADVFYYIPETEYSEAADNYLEESGQVTWFQREDALAESQSVAYADEDREITLMFFDMDVRREYNTWKYIGDYQAPEDGLVYLPYTMQLDGGYAVGDPFSFSLSGRSYTMTVGGFIEDLYFGSLDMAMLSVYMTSGSFEQLYGAAESNSRGIFFFAGLETLNSVPEGELREVLGISGASNVWAATESLYSFDRTTVESLRTLMAIIMAAILIIFAFIVTLVCLLVVRFQVGISIDNDMQKIGFLKAAGYTSRQIIASFACQFGLSAAAGGLLGVALCAPLLPIIGDLLAVQTGLKWEDSYSFTLAALTLVLVLGITLAVSWLSARRVRRVTPITALRGGLTTHSFKRNRVPLERAGAPMSLLLAMKGTVQNLRQSAMIVVILTALSLAASFAVITSYNTLVDTSKFAEIPGVELSNAIAYLAPGEDPDRFAEDVAAYDQVEFVQYLDSNVVTVNDVDMTAYILEDYGTKRTNTVYEGRYPLHDNEVALGGATARSMGLAVGDTVTVRLQERERTYLICGMAQGTSSGGVKAYFTEAGYLYLDPDYTYQQLQIYLEEGEDTAAFLAQIEEDFGGQLALTVDIDKLLEDGMGLYISVVSAMCIAVLAVTVLVVVMVLYFVIHASVIRRRRELGIQKALGYTTAQLMNQMSLGFLLPVLAGIIAGTALGVAHTNTLLGIVFRAMGNMSADFIVRPSWAALFGAGILLVAYLTALAITSRIRKISAYSLVSE